VSRVSLLQIDADRRDQLALEVCVRGCTYLNAVLIGGTGRYKYQSRSRSGAQTSRTGTSCLASQPSSCLRSRQLAATPSSRGSGCQRHDGGRPRRTRPLLDRHGGDHQLNNLLV
jgi:hypothetical protein